MFRLCHKFRGSSPYTLYKASSPFTFFAAKFMHFATKNYFARGLMKKILTAGGVVMRKNNGTIEIALIKDSYGRWTFPKGHIESGEAQRAAALREVREEMGCKNLKIIRYLGKTNFLSREGGGKEEKRKIAHYYLMELAAGEKCHPQLEEGIMEIKWFVPDEALEKNDYANNIPILKKATREIKKITL